MMPRSFMKAPNTGSGRPKLIGLTFPPAKYANVVLKEVSVEETSASPSIERLDTFEKSAFGSGGTTVVFPWLKIAACEDSLDPPMTPSALATLAAPAGPIVIAPLAYTATASIAKLSSNTVPTTRPSTIVDGKKLV